MREARLSRWTLNRSSPKAERASRDKQINMLRLETSPEAEADLVDIWSYIADDQPDNADKFLDKLQAVAEKLAEFPGLGRARPELANNLKSFPVDRYSLFYCITEDALILVRVLTSARDIDNILG